MPSFTASSWKGKASFWIRFLKKWSSTLWHLKRLKSWRCSGSTTTYCPSQVILTKITKGKSAPESNSQKPTPVSLFLKLRRWIRRGKLFTSPRTKWSKKRSQATNKPLSTRSTIASNIYLKCRKTVFKKISRKWVLTELFDKNQPNQKNECLNQAQTVSI